MTRKEIEMLQEYLLNMHSRLELELIESQRVLQWRRADTVDAIEYIIAKERFNLFCEVFSDISHILRIYGRDIRKRELLDGKPDLRYNK